MIRWKSVVAVSSVLCTVGVLGGCGGGGSDTAAVAPPQAQVVPAAAEAQLPAEGQAPVEGQAPAQGGTMASAFSVADMWVKSADNGMSAAFGILRNQSGSDIVIKASTSDHSPVMELHETVEAANGEMIMREKQGGFVIPAGADYILEPGANHLMLMNIVNPVLPGNEVKFSLVFEDGSSFDFTAPAKFFNGANERYVPAGAE